jgi:NADH-quinone oxidoreductase subunit N
VTAFIATVSKGSVFGLTLRYFAGISLFDHPQVFVVFTIIAVASMFVGNLLALFQNNIKRILAYSSIAHFGYLLVAFLSSGPLRVTAVTFYLVAYFVTTLGTFGVVTLLSPKERDAEEIEEYVGLFDRRPWLAGAFVLMLLSLAGMPLTVGFVGKIYVIAAGIGSLLWMLVIVLIVNSAIGLFYYLRIVIAVFQPSIPGGAPVSSSVLKGKVLMAVLFILLVWWGVYPIHLINLIERIGIGR